MRHCSTETELRANQNVRGANTSRIESCGSSRTNTIKSLGWRVRSHVGFDSLSIRLDSVQLGAIRYKFGYVRFSVRLNSIRFELIFASQTIFRFKTRFRFNAIRFNPIRFDSIQSNSTISNFEPVCCALRLPAAEPIPPIGLPSTRVR